MRHSFAFALVVLALASSLAADADSRAAPPNGAALNAAVKMVDETFRDSLVNSRTLEQRIAAAAKLLDFSKHEKDAVARFALLLKAREVALECGDVAIAFAAIDDLGKTFVLDPARMKADALIAASKTTQTVLQHKRLSVEACDTAKRAVLVDQYDLANAMEKIGADAARLANDPELMVIAAAQAAQIKEAEAAYPVAAKAMAVLARNPRDADANLTVGKFCCFIKNDWETGLPMLAKASDPALKALAEKEVAGAAAGEPQALIADGWWEMADKVGGAGAGRIRQHAASGYASALPHLSGLHRALADKRVKEGSAVTSAAIGAISQARRNVVDLLAVLDTSRGAISGSWILHDGALSSPASRFARLQIPYHPPAEYDMHVRFVRLQGHGAVAVILAGHGRQFPWLMGQNGNTLQFEIIENQFRNPTILQLKPGLVNGRVYETTVKVRADGIEAYLNDRRVAAWKTDYHDMSISTAWLLKDRTCVGVGAVDDDVKFLSVTVTEVSGPGEITNDRRAD